MSEGVDAAVIECGIGGAYDSTNIIQHPSVTGITNLGIDHVGVLGSTLPEIAWHKAGIIKPGSKCFTTSTQLQEARTVLNEVAEKVGSPLTYVDIEPKIANGTVKLGLEAEFQKINASLGASIAREWLVRHKFDKVPDFEQRLINGLREVKWSGRCETRHENNITWYIDGGHTLESIKLAALWYASTRKQKSTGSAEQQQQRYLIFNQQTRDAGSLAKALHDTLATTLNDNHPFTNVIFCTNTTFKEAGFRPDLISVNTNSTDVEALKVQRELAETWSIIDSTSKVEVVRTIEEAVEIVRASSQSPSSVSALVTGSLHLVGGFLEVIESQ